MGEFKFGLCCTVCGHIEFDLTEIWNKCPNCGTINRDLFIIVEREDIEVDLYIKDKGWLCHFRGGGGYWKTNSKLFKFKKKQEVISNERNKI